ncbi:LLM class flavin-dependent oxidoreductase [Roseomonas sp. NAR14]|uniref:LLM class flavin-dependent oxidoreductase n=1 Tax=Roseomonas acroporae TaxID=2937791 RepID=A0A9X1Y942_9PROT|nr:LLM class flavin-dependent oxidoreductase [Roseomonas acroporae]MCK8786144.1 LLM class flavin-dependent oxidoreductase [Roseomonas acroporae]
MTRPIRLNAFNMATPGSQASSLWGYPGNEVGRYNTLAYWKEMCAILERGLFDGLFLADVIGVYDTYGGTPDAALRHAVSLPILDPVPMLPALADATTHLGFGVTCTLTYEPPHVFARRMSTLDHLTGGRIGWNIVTGFLQSTGRAATGQAGFVDHSRRYDMAEEFMEVVYRLWEGSWEDDAACRDRARGCFADPARVRKVSFSGEFFGLDTIHLCEPSPQRTPTLFQAGASGRGRAFAGKHAEGIFVAGPSRKVIAEQMRQIRAEAVRAGRAAGDIVAYALATAIVAGTEREAWALYDDYRRHVDPVAGLAHLSGLMGIDLAQYGMDEVLTHIDTNAMRSAVDSFTSADPDRRWTIRELGEHQSLGGRGPVFVGTAAQVADRMQEWMEATDIDGFNLAYVVAHRTYRDVVDLLVPELQRRGAYPTAYAPGTLRAKLSGTGRDRLAPPHPGARFRYGAAV